MQYFMSKGLTLSKALEIRAGIAAEGGTVNAINPKSGAFGIGQWLGSRKKALFAKYGPRPTLQNQLDFMWSELNGGDAGGKAVLNAKGAGQTLAAYIVKFMRPAAGAETRGDFKRGAAYLRQWAAQTHANNVRIGTVNIYTKASDPKAVAREVRGLGSRSTVVHADQGVRP
jgi:hypothetical protein